MACSGSGVCMPVCLQGKGPPGSDGLSVVLRDRLLSKVHKLKVRAVVRRMYTLCVCVPCLSVCVWHNSLPPAFAQQWSM